MSRTVLASYQAAVSAVFLQWVKAVHHVPSEGANYGSNIASPAKIERWFLIRGQITCAALRSLLWQTAAAESSVLGMDAVGDSIHQ